MHTSVLKVTFCFCSLQKLRVKTVLHVCLCNLRLDTPHQRGYMIKQKTWHSRSSHLKIAAPDQHSWVVMTSSELGGGGVCGIEAWSLNWSIFTELFSTLIPMILVEAHQRSRRPARFIADTGGHQKKGSARRGYETRSRLEATWCSARPENDAEGLLLVKPSPQCLTFTLQNDVLHIPLLIGLSQLWL